MVKVSTSILSIKDNIIEEVKKINNTNTDFIHYDIMDGKFVSNKSFSFDDIKKINNFITKPLDIHLMVEEPLKYIEFYKDLNPEYITIHYEIDNYINYINVIKSYNIKAGISIKPKTLVEDIFPLLNNLDLVLVMSVEPGMGGQEFIEDSLTKIRKLKQYIEDNNLKTIIEVDGGINDISAKECIKQGADILVCGSYITNSDNYQEKINKIKSIK